MAVFLSEAQCVALEHLAANDGVGQAGVAPLRWPTVRVLQKEGLVDKGETRRGERTVRYNFGREWENRTYPYVVVRLTEAGRKKMGLDK